MAQYIIYIYFGCWGNPSMLKVQVKDLQPEEDCSMDEFEPSPLVMALQSNLSVNANITGKGDSPLLAYCIKKINTRSTANYFFA